MDIYKLVFSPIAVNTYILADKSGNCAILDCGCYNEKEFLSLVKLVDSKKLNPVLLINTHCHLDHIFGNKFIFEKYNLRAHCSELEESNLKNASEHARFFGLSMETPPEPECYIAHHQIITFDNTSLLALLVPGHTTGSIAFYSEKDKCVFTGDALFAGSIGRTDLPGGDYQTLIDSLRNNLLTLPVSTIVYPGHGNETTIGKEIRTNPYLI
jgi:glyoxylase-like metal-dependent hydrolase (beta-lactamase superfamily II)